MEQYYGYLKDVYEEQAYVDTNQLTDYYYDMAYEGKWREGLQFPSTAPTPATIPSLIRPDSQSAQFGGSRTHATVSCPKAFRVNL